MLFVPRGALIDAVRNASYIGITGLIECDEVGECNASGPSFYQVVDGAWVPLALVSN
jgi:branched-chain amino acid transport system substrate-binding protein